MAHRELRRSVLPLVLFATVVLAATRYAPGSAPPFSSPSEGQQIGKILSVRKTVGSSYLVNRYGRIHSYQLNFAVRVSDQTYCSVYETPVLDEIDDLFAAKDKDVEIVLTKQSWFEHVRRNKKSAVESMTAPPCTLASRCSHAGH